MRFAAYAAAALLGSTLAASAGGIAVHLDEARMVTFKKPVATVYVGNPSIADITVIDSRHVFVLGKTFGTTNLIGLDAKGAELFNDTLQVQAQSAGIVTVNRGVEQMTYSCAQSRCQPAPVPGDGQTFYSTVTGQVAQHEGANTQAANNPAAGGNH